MRIQKFGHACLLVTSGDGDAAIRVLTDPGVWSPGFEDLRGIAAVLITHQHADHLDVDRLETLLDANSDAVVLADAGSIEQLGGRGITATAVAGGARHDIGGLSVEVIGDQHALIHADVPLVPNVGYLIGGRLFHPGDALTVPEQPVQILALPTAAPWMKTAEGVDYLRAVAPRVAVPIHDKTLAHPEMDYRRYADLAPEGSTVTALDDGVPRQF